jgi:DNA-binding transcriptional MerR regulator
MAQPDPGAQSGATDPQSGNGMGQQGSTTASDPNATGQAASGQPDPNASGSATVSRSEYDALMRRMQAADQNAAKYQQQLKQHEDAQLTEQQKLQKQLEEANAALAEREKQLLDQQVETAMLADSTYTWHNPKTVLQLVDRELIQWAKDGRSVESVKAAMDKLAKDHPYLVKPAETAPPTTTAPTGVPMNNGRVDPQAGNQTTLEQRFPALRGRVPKRG